MADVEFITLSTKPGARLSYTFQTPAASTTTPPTLVVFLNGLGLPQTSWQPVITELTTLRQSKGLSVPSFLTYDRFGQGQTTDRDPQDADAEDPSHGHDCLSAVHDLHQLLIQLIPTKLGVSSPDSVRLIFVANSLGCALARLYAAQYPGSIAALVLLDSVLANSDFVSIFPDPDSADFNPSLYLPDSVDVNTLRAVRAATLRIFHPSVPNKESLSRRNLPDLLPHSDKPLLVGPSSSSNTANQEGEGKEKEKGPLVTVIGHSFDAFATESAKMGVPTALTNAFLNPFWERYNEGLVRITDPGLSKGPLRAPGAGHFVQKDNPGFVAGEVGEVLERLLLGL